MKVSIEASVLQDAWGLINSREWPFSLMPALASVKSAMMAAVGEDAPDEAESSDRT